MRSLRTVLVAVATVGEPEGCEAAVQALVRQRVPEDMELSVLVVDNNRRPQRYDLPADVNVVHEPEPGIGAARNAAIDVALGSGADVLSFIDDDELPVQETWLATLVEGLEELPADVTTGPVDRAFEEAVPAWAAAHPLFRRRRYTTGTVRPRAATGNVAIRTDALRASGLRFDERLGLVGGEDTEWSRRLVAAGYTIRWVAEAEVLERVPASRATVRWILKRSWRIGANRIERRRLETPGDKPLVLLIAGACGEVALGTVGGLLLAVPSRRLALVAVGRAARGLGCLAAAVGFEYREYEGRSIG